MCLSKQKATNGFNRVMKAEQGCNWVCRLLSHTKYLGFDSEPNGCPNTGSERGNDKVWFVLKDRHTSVCVGRPCHGSESS